MSNIDKQIKYLNVIINIIVLMIGFFCGFIYEREFNPTNFNDTHIEESVTDNPLGDAELMVWSDAYGIASNPAKRCYSIVPTSIKQEGTKRLRVGKLVD